VENNNNMKNCIIGLLFILFLVALNNSSNNAKAIEDLSNRLDEKERKLRNIEKDLQNLLYRVDSCYRQNSVILIKQDKILENIQKIKKGE
jgi:hypothetical protein